jgi:hypothetical protein
MRWPRVRLWHLLIVVALSAIASAAVVWWRDASRMHQFSGQINSDVY